MNALLRAAAATLMAVCAVSISAQPKLVAEEFMLPTSDAGISLYVRNVGNARTPPVRRAPNGVMADSRDYWGRGMPLYDPADIRVPTLLAHAEWDADLPSSMFYAYFGKLVNTPYKRAVQIGEGTHTVLLEKNRLQLFREVQQLLDETTLIGK